MNHDEEIALLRRQVADLMDRVRSLEAKQPQPPAWVQPGQTWTPAYFPPTYIGDPSPNPTTTAWPKFVTPPPTTCVAPTPADLTLQSWG